MKALKHEDRAPRLIVLENVYGALTSHGGKDFSAICTALSQADYRFGAIVMDARDFVPQSRQRVFFIAVAAGVAIPRSLTAATPSKKWHPEALIEAQAKTTAEVRQHWIWWKLRAPPLRNAALVDIIEDEPFGIRWHTPKETEFILDLMTPINRAKVEAAKLATALWWVAFIDARALIKTASNASAPKLGSMTSPVA